MAVVDAVPCDDPPRALARRPLRGAHLVAAFDPTEPQREPAVHGGVPEWPKKEPDSENSFSGKNLDFMGKRLP